MEIRRVSRKARMGHSNTWFSGCEFFLDKTLKIILRKFVGNLGLSDNPKCPLSPKLFNYR